MGTRLGLALGLAAAGAVTVWWLAASRVAIEGGADPSRVATEALFALLLVRTMLIAVSAPRAAAVGGYVAGVRGSLPVASAAWPVAVLAWAASNDAALRTVANELGVLGWAALAPLIGRAFARLMGQGPLMEAAATGAGVLAAAALWFLLPGPARGP